MKKYLIFSAIFLLCSVALVSATEPSIVVENQQILDYNVYGDNIFLGTGDQVFAQIKVTDADKDISRAYMRWGSSWVDCKRTEMNNLFHKYNCLLTVTPFMSTDTEVYLVAESRNGNSEILLGSYEFRGWQFPTQNGVHPNGVQYPKKTNMCHTEIVCSKFNSSGECIRTRNKRVCVRA